MKTTKNYIETVKRYFLAERNLLVAISTRDEKKLGIIAAASEEYTKLKNSEQRDAYFDKELREEIKKVKELEALKREESLAKEIALILWTEEKFDIQANNAFEVIK